jgi:hypothetical protein
MTSTVDNRSILLVVSAENCGACKVYSGENPEKKNVFELVRKQVEADGLARYEHIKVKTIGAPIDAKYPAAINKWIRFYPTFILVNGKDWNTKMEGIDEKNPNIEVFNARIVDGVVVTQGGSMQSPDKIPEWVKNNVENSVKFKMNIISKSPTLTLRDAAESKEEPIRLIPTCGTAKILAASRR